ncbi:MAG: FkbM family methyltransferase [Gemmataceae bacterium]|nr:FkbM family methyltransferase [Gemmata sp.]MDW8196945.1 FkbM family methyltransferase [Gemmataceae bacterium]
MIGLAAGGASGWAASEWRQRRGAFRSPEEEEIAAEQTLHGAMSYAQFGEDLIMKGWFPPLKLEKPTYLDIGSAEPIAANNTYLFYTLGSRGVLVEPNVALSEKIRRIRPGDQLLVAGVGVDEQQHADYFVMSAPNLNTFDRQQAEHVEKTSPHRVVQVVKMPLLTINRVIAEYFGHQAPDILSIDIEGWDFAVLKTLDFTRYRPKIICVETVIYNTFHHNADTPRLLAEKGYELHGMTFANKIYVDQQLLR